MVGGKGGQSGSAGRLTTHAGGSHHVTGLRAAYETAADGWAEGPEQVYARLAQALVAAAAAPLPGCRVLDLGAGTGAAGRAALAAGARQVVAADLAVAMLRHSVAALRPVAADATALPVRDHSFDLVLGAFCLNHLASISAGLRESRRVGRAIAASMFAPGWTHPAKAAVDEALRRSGYRPPAWYERFKRETEPQAGDPARLAEHATAAGYARVHLRVISVPTGLSTPAELASWRLGMAHVAPFVASLEAPRRAAVRQAAEHAVATAGAGPLVVSMLVLTAG
jgi:ubiquinone/menaquinone biosynthesis C-methylase UbiE